MNGIQEVSGSIPLISTTKQVAKTRKSSEIEGFQNFFLYFEFNQNPRVWNVCGMQKKTLEALETMRYIIWESQIGKAEYGTEQTTNYYTVYMGVLHVPVRFRNCTGTCCFTFDQLAERLPSVVLHPDTTIAPTVSFVQG